MNIFFIVESKLMKSKGFKKPGEIIKFLGIKRQTYYTWRNRGEIPLKELFKIAEKTEIPIQKLIQNEYRNENDLDDRIKDIIALLKDDPEGKEAVFHFLEAKKNFDRASKLMKVYLGKKLEVWMEFPGADNDKKKIDSDEEP